MKSFASVFTLVVFCCFATVVAADPGSNPEPMTQAVRSLDKNIDKNPDVRGLQNAARRVLENIDRFEAKRAAKGRSRSVKNKQSQDRDRIERTESIQKPERVERVERVARPERPERPDRPDRPDRVDRPDRPDRPNRPDLPARARANR